MVRHGWHGNFLSVTGRYRSTTKLPIEMSDLYEISAGVVKDSDGGSGRFGWFLGEGYAVLLEIRVLFLNIGDEEIGRRNSLLMDLLLEGFRSRILIEFENKLYAFRFFRGDDGEPFVGAGGKFVFLLEAEFLGVELEGLVLVVDEYAGEFDLHGVVLSAGGWRGIYSHRHKKTITIWLLIVKGWLFGFFTFFRSWPMGWLLWLAEESNCGFLGYARNDKS
jgi:hypothetical protein